jgi:Domain of unknown function (DUF4037)
MTVSTQSGAKLCERFYWSCVRPILDTSFPGLPHAAALIDSGSEVLGYDDAMSTDQTWGPRVLLFLPPADHPRYAHAVHDALARQLPYEFEGYPTNFTPPDADDHGTQLLERLTEGPVHHRVPCHTFPAFIAEYLNFDLAQPLEPVDWLTSSEQRLLTITTGPVYYDAIGLNEARARFNYYPQDVWLYLLAAGWTRLGQEEHLMGRAGGSDDEIGSAIIGARLVRDIMRLCFLMERTYAPYPKWFGAAFRRLAPAHALSPLLAGALHAQTWQERETYLVPAYAALAARHNGLGLTEPLPGETASFFGRPFQVIALHGFAQALLRQVRDPRVQNIAQLPLIGRLDLFSDNTDLNANPFWRPRLRQLYRDSSRPTAG